MPSAISASVQQRPRTAAEAAQNLQRPDGSYRAPPLYIRIVYERRGTFYSDLIEVPRPASEHNVRGLLERRSFQCRSFLDTALRSTKMFLLMQRNSVEVVAVEPVRVTVWKP
jgi:hypothetical protein